MEKKVLSDGIVQFVEYVIELKLTQAEVFVTLINDIVARSDHYRNTQECARNNVDNL